MDVKRLKRAASGLWVVGLPTILGFSSTHVLASGFAIRAQSASNLGTAGAADTGGSQDISAIYSNPAAIGLFTGQRLTLGLGYIDMNTRFKDGMRTLPFIGTEVNTEAKTTVQDFSNDGVVPAFFGTHQVSDSTHLGWSLTVPLASNSHYGKDWVGRYHAIDTKLQVVNLDLGVSHKILPQLSLGAGLQIQHGKGLISGASNLGALGVAKAGRDADLALKASLQGDNSKLASLTGMAKVFADNFRQALASGKTTQEASSLLTREVAAATGQADGKSDFVLSYEGEGYALGYNLGFVYSPVENLQLGLSYRSQVKHKTEGDVAFTTASPSAEVFISDQGFEKKGSLELTVPEVLSFGAAFNPMPALSLFLNVAQTGWSSLENLELKYKNAAGEQKSRTKLDWKNSLYMGLGAAYQVNAHYVLRTGIARDNTPTSDQYRSPRSPDNDRTMIAVGGGYVGDSWNVDLGLAHTAIKDPTLNLNENDYEEAKGRGNLSGKYQVSANTLMVQYGYQL